MIVVTIDTLRADHLDLYGYPKDTAPFIRSLGEQSAVFTNAFSTSSWTAPATASLFTGRYPVFHGVTMGIHAHRRIAEQVEKEGKASIELNRIPDELALLPEVLGRAGYATFGVSTNLNVGHEIGFDRGFDRFKRKNMASAEYVRDRLRSWRDEILASEPWLLYLHLNDAHAPYEGRAPWYQKSRDERQDVVAAYDSEIRYVDGILAEILGDFDAEGSALVLLLSDHGEEFWERGELGHRLSLHGEVNRVVFAVHGPAVGVRPSRREENVSLVDVLPTLVELLGIEGPAETDGVSLARLVRGNDEDGAVTETLRQRALIGHRVDETGSGRELWSAVRGAWKLIQEGPARQLYELSSDPGERLDRASEDPSIAKTLSDRVAALRSRASQVGDARVEISIDAGRLEALRKLGYVEE